MKVAFVNQPWSFIVAPVQRADSIGIWSYRVARHLATKAIAVMYAKRWQSLKPLEECEGIEYRRVSTITRLAESFKGLDQWQFFPARRPFYASTLYHLEYIWKIANDINKQQFDIVHIHNFSQFVPIVRAINPDVKIVLHMHCEWLTQLDAQMIVKRLKQTDMVIGCSEYITDKIQKRFPEYADRCHTVFNGVEVEEFISKGYQKLGRNGVPQILFVGRVSPEKGVHVLIDAFRDVTQYFPQAQLKIVGPEAIAPKEYIVRLSDEPKVAALDSLFDESYLNQLQRRVPEALKGQVTFVGAIPHTELMPYYQEADVLVNPSLSEAFGMSLVEGMATETPVIGVRNTGMTSVVEDGKTGFLVESGNAKQLAQAIIRLISDQGLGQSMGKAGRERVINSFSWERITDSLLSNYTMLCSKPRVRA
uniref:Glycosyl transferase group 1 n=1 Tax=Cyanothece sp. (strain PCC 7425 / ATCC 29141) TaxID=395961 RepID=B8HV68_CYAP4